MGKRKRDIDVSIELGWTEEQVARALGLSPSGFADRRAQLEAWGFPMPHFITGRYVVDQVRAWYCKRPEELGGPKPVVAATATVEETGPGGTPTITLPAAPQGAVSKTIAERLKHGAR